MAKLTKGQLFHNRYLLVEPLGQGASAEVWMAQDTRANNLLVALKIFSENSEMDTNGMQNFEKEFTNVYNMKHSKLLPPTGYDICEGRPYLIMNYCENGSSSSMVGRMEEEDVIRLLHDVSAGLEYLHDHNIIHQDIKPDNILVDDNCNYVVTDFGISVNSEGGIFNTNGMSGGTRAYMGPERFDGKLSNASDMWSLGATAVEMLTGNPPYGEHGGLLQAEGEPLPELPAKLQPEVKDIIKSTLSKDPEKRMKPNEVRQKIEHYWETGSWNKRSAKMPMIYLGTALACILLCLGIFFWDYNRTKVYYYKDYAEYYGVPKGIGKLSKSEASHREQTYRFEYNKHKLRRVTLVNGYGKTIGHTDTEHQNTRFADVQYFYTDEGKVDYTIVSDQNGKVLFKLDYDDGLKTATFRQNDEYGTEMNLAANTNQLFRGASSALDEKSRISRYLLTFDDDGLLTERRYVGLQNVPAGDKDNIYGIRYEYDGKGRMTKQTFLGADGNPTGNSDGLSARVYTYDDDDNWTSVTYLNAEGGGSHDGNNCTLVKLTYDKYGNRASEMYYSMDEEPSIRTDLNVAGFEYTYNDHGNRITQTSMGIDGKPAYNNLGYVTERAAYDDNGFYSLIEYLDENGDLTLFTSDGMSYASVKVKSGPTGLPEEFDYLDQDGNPIEQFNGVARIVNSYDDKGNLLSQKYFGKDGKPTAYDGFYHERRIAYNDFNNVISESYFDTEGKPTTEDGIVSVYDIEYNRQGAMTKMSFLGTDEKPVNCSGLFAGYTITYDELGNQKSFNYFNKEGKPVISQNGYASMQYVYDPKTNFLIETDYLDTNGKKLFSGHNKYDARGNVTESYTLDASGNLRSGTVVEHKEYDVNNRVTSVWGSDLSGHKTNLPGQNVAQVKYEYDQMGNNTLTTYWKADGTPGTDSQQSHRREQKYDNMNRVIAEFNFGVDGKPTSGPSANPEGRVKYDQWGNIAELSCYDGYGNPRLSADGFFMMKASYDRRGNPLVTEYFDTNNKLINSKSKGYAKVENKYDTHGNLVEAKYSGPDKVLWIERWAYNDKNRMTEMKVLNGAGNLTDEKYGVARLVIEYDQAGTTPKTQKYYNAAGQLLGSQTWNADKGDWNEIKTAGGNSAPTGVSSVQAKSASAGGDWMAAVRNDARQCPMRVDDGIYLQSITCTPNSVTVTIKLIEVSKYDMDDVNESQLAGAARELKSSFRQIWGLPSSVKMTVLIQDKANRTLFTF